MDEKTDKDLSQEIKEAKLKFLRHAGKTVPDSAIVAINSLLRDYEINGQFTNGQREFVKKLIKTSQSLRT